ncbi:hypothetical protein Tco_1386795 [Tanacetum coccineum]
MVNTRSTDGGLLTNPQPLEAQVATLTASMAHAGYGRLTKVEFPKFEGEEVVSWVYKVNKFFEMDNIVENEQKMRFVSMHLFGKALNWHSAPYNKGGGTVAKNVVTMLVQAQTIVPNRPFRRLTQREMEDKRAKQLCFYCDQKYTPGHKCSGQMYSLEVFGCDEELVEEECMASE